MSHLTGPDRAVLWLAGQQHGAISWPQLRQAGASEGWVRHRLETGWLRRAHRGVYIVGPLTTSHTQAMAAVLAVGEGAVLSHYPGAVLWELRPLAQRPLDVTVPGRKTRAREALRVHRTALHPADLTRHQSIPVTSPARTLLDLATQVTQRELDRAVEQAQVLHLASMRSLTEQFSRYPRHRGTAALKAALQTEPRLTRSEAERRMLELIRDAGLPRPETNVQIAGYEVDLLWRAQKLVLEIDGYDFHSSRRSFERDRRKESDLVAAGLRVARVTWRQLTGEAIGVAARLATALAA